MAKRFATLPLKTILLVGITSCFTLPGCNKLGYEEVRTAPEGQAMLGPKRMPPLNQAAMQQNAAMNQQRASQMRPQQMMSYPPQQQPGMQQPSAPMQQAPAQPPMATPYGGGAQSYQPATTPAAPADQSSYHLPYEFSPGSYYAAETNDYQNPSSQGLARTVSATDYYSQDMRMNAAPQQAMSPAQLIHSEQYSSPYQPQPHMEADQWYAPAAPVAQVQGRNLPVTAPESYHAGYSMDAAYGRYQDVPETVMPLEPSFYQPMTAKHAANHPAIDPYSPQAAESHYSNFYYGGQGMPQGQAPNYAPPQSQGIGGGYQQAPNAGMYNPVGQQRVVEENIRRPLEEPPMLARETILPNPNNHAQPYYGDGQYR